MDAFRDHGRLRSSLEEDITSAKVVMDALPPLGISIEAVTAKLVDDGVRLFADAADHLYAAVQNKRRTRTRRQAQRDELQAAAGIGQGCPGCARGLAQGGQSQATVGGRRFAVDGDGRSPLAGLAGDRRQAAEGCRAPPGFRGGCQADGVQGRTACSAWAGRASVPRCWAKPSATQPGFPKLHVLNSTDPAQIRRFEARIDPTRTLFLVSSKSGSTLEPNIFKQYFYERAKQAVGASEAPKRFVAITDPGSSLEKAALTDGFRCVFHGLPSIGGRYSVLSDFGMVPAGGDRHRSPGFPRKHGRDGAVLRGERTAGREPRSYPRCDPRDLPAPGPRQGDGHCLPRYRRFWRVARAASRRIHR